MGKSPMENSDGSRQIDIGILVGLVKELGVTLRPGPANKDAGKWDKICALYRMVLPKQGNFVTSSDLKRAYYSLKTTNNETNEDSGPPTKRPRVSQACFSKLQCSTEHWDMLFEDPSVIIPVPIDLNGSGANIFLCGEDGYKVALHEFIFRKYTNIIDIMGEAFDLDSLKDPFGNIVIILAGVDTCVLKALVEMLYTGQTVVHSNEVAEAVRGFLTSSIEFETKRNLFAIPSGIW